MGKCEAKQQRCTAKGRRVLSADGKMHGDLNKAAKDETLEASLFAAFNTE